MSRPSMSVVSSYRMLIGHLSIGLAISFTNWAVAQGTDRATNETSETSSTTTTETRESTVGFSQRIEQLRLPGTELEAIPVEDREQPIVLRVVASFPHGTDFRYDLEYYGLEPGEYDLRTYLRRIDGSSTDDLPEMNVKINPLLPPGQVVPHELEAAPMPRLGGYRMLLIAGGIVWTVGLALLFFWRPKTTNAAEDLAEQPATVAERLRRLAEEARAGQLTPDRHAELEHLLLAHWRTKLNVADLSPAKAIAKLREDDEAGALLRKLEQWLHAPNQPDKLDLELLLRPYEQASPPSSSTSTLSSSSSSAAKVSP